MDNIPQDIGFILSLCGVFFIPFILLGVSLLIRQMTETTTSTSRGWGQLLIIGAFTLLVGGLIWSIYLGMVMLTDFDVIDDFETGTLFSRWASFLNVIGYLIVALSTLFLIRAYLRDEIRFKPLKQK